MCGNLKAIKLHLALSLFTLGVCAIVLGYAVLGCGKEHIEVRGGEKRMPTKSIEQVLKEHTDAWMSIPGVVGTAIGELKGKPCIKILVVQKTEELTKKIPSQVEGFPVILEETGEIRALRAH